MYGIDVVIPDFTYLIKNKDKIRGIFLTHGHEDHIGAIPYVLRDVKAPIYATRMTAGLVKLQAGGARPAEQDQDSAPVRPARPSRPACFPVEFIHVNHSIADACGLRHPHARWASSSTPATSRSTPPPSTGGMIDLAPLWGSWARRAFWPCCADSTNVERPGYTKSERSVGDTL